MDWVTRQIAAKRLGVHARTIDRWIREGKLEGSWLTSKCVRVSVFSIDRLLQQGRN